MDKEHNKEKHFINREYYTFNIPASSQYSDTRRYYGPKANGLLMKLLFSKPECC